MVKLWSEAADNQPWKKNHNHDSKRAAYSWWTRWTCLLPYAQELVVQWGRTARESLHLPYLMVSAVSTNDLKQAAHDSNYSFPLLTDAQSWLQQIVGSARSGPIFSSLNDYTNCSLTQVLLATTCSMLGPPMHTENVKVPWICVWHKSTEDYFPKWMALTCLLSTAALTWLARPYYKDPIQIQN